MVARLSIASEGLQEVVATKGSMVGIDVGKRSFAAAQVDVGGKVIAKKRKLSREQLVAWLGSLPPAVVVMESCPTSHHWGREISELGHEVRLIHPGHVTPYRTNEKNDLNDALAICEASARARARFITVKTVDEQGVLSLHSFRQQLMHDCVALSNHIRSTVEEFGHLLPESRTAVLHYARAVLDEPDALRS